MTFRKNLLAKGKKEIRPRSKLQNFSCLLHWRHLGRNELWGLWFCPTQGVEKASSRWQKSWNALKKGQKEKEVGEGHHRQSRCGYFPRGMQDGKSLTEVMNVVVVVLGVGGEKWGGFVCIQYVWLKIKDNSQLIFRRMPYAVRLIQLCIRLPKLRKYFTKKKHSFWKMANFGGKNQSFPRTIKPRFGTVS